MQPPPQKPKGSITLIAVFLTALIAFLLAFGDHVGALQENAIAQSDAATERAFFAAQACVEEGFLGLRTDASYMSPYTAAAPLLVGNATCILEVIPDGPGAPSGTLRGIGIARETMRTISATYRDAGPTNAQADTSIFHVLDISTSMGQGTKLADAKAAAIAFLDHLNPAHDAIGLVSYNRAAYLNQDLTVNFPAVGAAVNALTISLSGTNIGDAIALTKDRLVLEPPTRRRVEILLTDGYASWPPPSSFAAQHARDQAAIAKAAPQNVTIITIGLGAPGEFDPQLLRDIASENPETHQPLYWHAPNSSDLQRIYDEIAQFLTTYAISQVSWDEE